MLFRSLLRESSPPRIGWDALQVLSGLTTGFVLPFALLAPHDHGQHHGFWITLAVIGILDAMVQSGTPYEHRGEIQKDPRQILRHYLKTWLTVDVVANLAFFFVPLSPSATWLQLLRCSKVFRVLSNWENRQVLNSLLLRISRYSLGLLLLTNWISCIWLWIGLNGEGPDSWIERSALSDQSYSRQYLMAVYWSVTTLASVGYGDITPKTNPEIITAIIVMALGVILFAFAIGNVVAFVSQLDDGKSEYRMQQAGIRRYLAFNGVSSETLSRLRQFSDFLWSQSRGSSPDEILSKLPATIRTEIISEMLQGSVSTVPLFSNSPASLRNRLLMLLRPEFFPPGSIILSQDEPGDEIVFITHGRARLVSEKEEEVSDSDRYFEQGDYFGDLSFFLKEHRNSSAVAETYVEAFLLNRSLFNNLIKQDPRLRTIIQTMASGQSERNQNLLLAGIIL